MRLKIKKRLKGKEEDFVLDVDISVKDGSIITIFGKSGAGKTTILRAIAGLTDVDEGFIEVSGHVWFDSEKGIDLPPHKREVGFVFQDYALFPNMTVEENIAFGMKDKDTAFLEEILELTELSHLRNRMPDTLSGGQKQRVALARAVARKPEILLLDEPLSALDYETRKKLQDELIKIHRRFSLTTVIISHDFSEVFRLSDTVFVLDKGKILKSGKPEDIFIQERISGKVKFSGTVLSVEEDETVFIVSVLIGNNVVKVIADPEEAENLQKGDTVIVATKAFNPFLLKT
ncbi:ATP-binding cassette domain-containing protein [Persephonella atlantica]|uniref:ATP-binding cassette domain-containing protein n=1 Tax=Persephonella atlantica TaxID=2699429 RepID=A0ABS1GIJ3_9AQUI|nr:ATP-binding cassette domain-containing protein [Persephonella atlantica]MBK3332761.1 ATP-binding cassette domain-containing protein [Persephonella atlantica]